MIAAGGNWLHELLIGDAVYSMQTELGNLIRSLAANLETQAQQGNTLGLVTGGLHAAITAVAGVGMLLLLIVMLLLLRVFSAVGISYITTLGNANLDLRSLMDVGLWMLAVVPLFVSGMLASLKCGELASMLGTSTGAAGSGLMGMAATAGTVAAVLSS